MALYQVSYNWEWREEVYKNVVFPIKNQKANNLASSQEDSTPNYQETMVRPPVPKQGL